MSTEQGPRLPGGSPVIISTVKQLVVDMTAADAAHDRLGRHKVSERLQDGSPVLVPGTVDEVIAETADRPLDGDRFLEAQGRLGAAASRREHR